MHPPKPAAVMHDTASVLAIAVLHTVFDRRAAEQMFPLRGGSVQAVP